MDLYRKRKLKEIIKKSNPDFEIVITTYRRSMNDFFKDILLKNDHDTKLPNLYSDYFKTNEALLSPLEKARIYEEYMVKRATFEKYAVLSGKFIAALDTIKLAHNELNKKSDSLTNKDFRELNIRYATDMEAILSEFKKLKKSSQK
ncbi:MAG: hypothetical protein ABI707_00210 [Ferruginibacter sp.]